MENLSSPQVQQQPQQILQQTRSVQTQSSRFKKYVVLMVILALSIGFGGGYVLFLNKSHQLSSNTNSLTAISPSTTTTMAGQEDLVNIDYTPVDTSSWLYLTNNTCGLSLLYPPSWTIIVNNEGPQEYVGDLRLWNSCIIEIATSRVGESVSIGVGTNVTSFLIINDLAPNTSLEEQLRQKRDSTTALNAKGFNHRLFKMLIDNRQFEGSIDDITSTEVVFFGGYFANNTRVFDVVGSYIPNDSESRNTFFTILGSVRFQ